MSDTAFIYDLKSGSAVGTWDDQRGPLMMHYNNLSPATLERDAQKLRPKLRSSAFSEENKRNKRPRSCFTFKVLNDQNLHKSNMHETCGRAEKVRLARLHRVRSTFKTSTQQTSSVHRIFARKKQAKKRDVEYSTVGKSTNKNVFVELQHRVQ